jgi:uncharacterized protein
LQSICNKYVDVVMKLTKKLEIQSKQKIIEFLNNKPVGPQVIPMNFVYVQTNDPHVSTHRTTKPDAIYMQSHPIGEKLDDIKRNSKVGFEVDRHVCFLPSYYFHQILISTCHINVKLYLREWSYI